MSVTAALAFTLSLIPVSYAALGIPVAWAQATQPANVLALEPGEAVVTRFSHTIDDIDANGNPITLIDLAGVSVSVVDVRNPPEPLVGQHWLDEPQRMMITASEVGQVFGVAIAQRPQSATPTIFVAATAAYGLHRLGNDWMPGMWGPGGGPGTIYRLTAENGYTPEIFADVTLGGRANTGASLGNIAYDAANDRLYVSDLETGMIHSLDAETGTDLGAFDHGADGRASFLDMPSQQPESLPPIQFDPQSEAEIAQCGPSFTSDPTCWNLADFRRRVWGLKVRTDEVDGVRLYYSVWGNDALANPDWSSSGDDKHNTMWSVGFADDGSFDLQSVRREFFLPDSDNNPQSTSAVSDVTFPECTAQNVMLLAERGGMRNLGLDSVEPFSNPYDSRVLRYEIDQAGIWQLNGRHDVGFLDSGTQAPLYANAAGGVDFGYKFDTNGIADLSSPSQSVWMTGDALCSPNGPCNSMTMGDASDQSEVHGLQGTPADGFTPLGAGVQQASTPQSGLYRSYMIDTDINLDQNGQPIQQELSRNDATKIGDVAVYQACSAPDAEPEMEQEIRIISDPPEEWPVHARVASHNKWVSSSHRVQSSWHYREGSWHDSSRSWHWRDGSWHQRERSWHRRDGSWHDRDRSWHYKSRSHHAKQRSWGDSHIKSRSFHAKSKSFGNDHRKDRSFHVKGTTWGKTHDKARSAHLRARSLKINSGTPDETLRPTHIKGTTYKKADPTHKRDRSAADTPRHTRSKSAETKVKVHERAASREADKKKQPAHSTRASRQNNADTDKPRQKNRVEKPESKQQPSHSRRESRANQGQDGDRHQRKQSRQQQDNAQ